MPIRRLVLRILTGLAGLILAAPALAGTAQVAVAANFSEPAREIATAFHKATGHTAKLSFGASGQFFAQISHGAPFDVFLSADAERPARAEARGLAVRGSGFTYAVGRLVLYSNRPDLVDPKGAVLRTARFHKLVIADPQAAPYGRAAVETLRKLGLYDSLKPRMVQGTSIAQAHQFTATGTAELGFLALSQVARDPSGSRWIVPADLHAPIDQRAVLLTRGRDNEAAWAFLAFLKGPHARAVIRRYGYEAP